MNVVTLDRLVEHFDVFIIDQFGVLVSGDGAYPHATQTLRWLKSTGKSIYILTNSGKLAIHSIERLRKLGFEPSDYTALVSSGEVAHKHLLSQFGKNPADLKIWYLTDSYASSPLQDIAVKYVDRPEHADLIIIGALDNEPLSIDRYTDLLKEAAHKRIPCLCTNPDFENLTASGIYPASGQVAKLYESLGGPVQMIGKPYSRIYQYVLDLVPQINKERIVCIGDSLHHDILGARNAGLKSVLVGTGVHCQLDQKERIELCVKTDIYPDFYIPRLAYSQKNGP